MWYTLIYFFTFSTVSILTSINHTLFFFYNNAFIAKFIFYQIKHKHLQQQETPMRTVKCSKANIIHTETAGHLNKQINRTTILSVRWGKVVMLLTYYAIFQTWSSSTDSKVLFLFLSSLWPCTLRFLFCSNAPWEIWETLYSVANSQNI